VLSLSTAVTFTVLLKAAWLEYSALEQKKKKTDYLQKVIFLSLFRAVRIEIVAV
jgi:hypothetical protein